MLELATPEGTVVISTGESGTTKFLRVDGDGTCSWQVPPNTQLTTEEVQDIVGAMVTGNTETGITVTYEDGDGTLDFVVTEATNVTAVANNSTDETVYPTFVDGATGTQAIETDTGLTYNPSTGLLTAVGLTLSGNLTVNGTTTTVASSTMTVADKNIEIAKGAANNAAADGAGITVDAGSDTDKTWNWVDADDAWTSSEHIKVADNKKLYLGAGNDFQIYHTGSAHKLIGANTGNIHIQGVETQVLNVAGSEYQAKFITDGAVELFHNGTKKIETTAAGVTVSGTVTDSNGDVRKIPYSTKTSAYTLVEADGGKVIHISSGGVTVPASVLIDGYAVTIINNSGSDQTITQGSGMTIYNTADAATGNRTLAGRGMATLYFLSSSTCYISGAGLS